MREGDAVYEEGAEADGLYLLERGRVAAEKSSVVGISPHGLLVYESGVTLGEVEFFLRQRRFFTARCGADCVLHRLTPEKFDLMLQEQPKLAALFQTALLRWTCRWVAVDINDGRRHHGKDVASSWRA
jgi:CRP-like cAMP-binding protein